MLIFCTASAMSCKKSKVEKEEDTEEEPFFDTNKAEDYYIYAKVFPDGNTMKVLFDFQPDKQVTSWRSGWKTTSPYTITENNTVISFDVDHTKITVDKGVVTGITSEGLTFFDITPIKKSDVGSLTEKIFVGSYLRSNGDVLHQNFFYRFIGNNKVEVGRNTGATTERTEDYEPIGNIGAWVEEVSNTNGHSELLLLINGRLEVNYYDKNSNPASYHHGSFEETPQ